jgi:hypothetical protein
MDRDWSSDVCSSDLRLAAEVPGGYDSPESEWPAIAESAVEAMATLFQFLEPQLAH